MLHQIKDLNGYKIQATNGEIGKVREFYFDDQSWAVRYLVADTGHWLIGQKVLISPVALNQPDWKEALLPVKLTKEQVENSPSIYTDQPVSRQYEYELHTYYDWPIYWSHAGGFLFRPIAPPVEEPIQGETVASEEQIDPDEKDPHLRSTAEVSGYDIQATDGKIGHVEDFIVDDTTWMIRYLVVDTGHWLSGKKVLIAPDWIDQVSWTKKDVHIKLARETVKNSPEFDPTKPITQAYEEQLYDYYGWLKYWHGKGADRTLTYFGQALHHRLIISVTNGERVGEVEDLLIDPDTYRVAALITAKSGLFAGKAKAILADEVNVWGQDAILISQPNVIVGEAELPEAEKWLSVSDDIKGREVVNPHGIRIGELSDIIIDVNGRIVAYELSKAFAEGPLAGQKLISINATHSLGQDLLVVDIPAEESQKVAAN